MRTKNRFLAVAVLTSFAFMTGCAANNALHKPNKKDERVLSVGQEKDLVRAELGAPVSQNGEGCDVFSYQEGSRPVSKFVRAFFEGIFSLASLGVLDILFLNPIEGMVGTDINRARVCYDNTNKVSRVDRLDFK